VADAALMIYKAYVLWNCRVGVAGTRCRLQLHACTAVKCGVELSPVLWVCMRIRADCKARNPKAAIADFRKVVELEKEHACDAPSRTLWYVLLSCLLPS
jgi:hypothetical protein